MISEKRRPRAFARREAPAGKSQYVKPASTKPVHAKQKTKLAPRTAEDDGKRRKGLNAYVDNRPQKNRPPSRAKPSAHTRTGAPSRPGGAGRTTRPPGGKPRSR